MAEFDYIIVGAGSAGAVLANRLSADPAHRVCLLEAGKPDNSAMINTPLGIVGLLGTRTYNWYFNTEPQRHLNNRSLYWPRGKTLGGSSSINAMIYIRGVPADYDGWEQAGNPGWGWSSVAPIFKALEHNERGGDALHGESGELNVADVARPNPLGAVFLQAAAEAGLAANPDFNGPVQEGSGPYQVTQKSGKRFSSARAFLDAIKSRPNLTIMTETRARRVLLAEQRAIGVEVQSPRGIERIMARAEVILAGGTVNSPHLLLLSGIGPRDEVERAGIQLRHELPGVGRNVQDHLDYAVLIKDLSKQGIGVAPSMVPRLVKAFMEYRRDKTGLLASNVAEVGGFARLTPESAEPEIQFHFLPSYLRDHGRKRSLGYGMTLHVCQLRPKSRGRIGLKNADPMADPLIDPDYLSAPDDLAELMAGVKLGRRIMAAPSMAAISGGEVEPGSVVTEDVALEARIRAQAETIYHPVGSCKMGHDAMAVVDDRLRVHGIAGLRVVDASIMPTLIGGNTNAPTMMIGEKASRMILADRNAPPAGAAA
jgi:choline dehydrogenase-like flavoprotein